MRLSVVALLVILASTIGCDPKSPAGNSGSNDTTQKDTTKTNDMNAPPQDTGIDILDVENGIKIQGLLAGESKSANISEDAPENARHYVDMSTINVKEPLPNSLKLSFSVKILADFSRNPIIVRTKVYKDKKEKLGEFDTVIGGAQARSTEKWLFDVLDGIESTPDTMLIYVESMAILMQEGTPLNVIDPSTVEGDVNNTAVIMGNPLRINFEKAND